MLNVDSEYKKILEERVKELETRIAKLKIKEENSKDLGTRFSSRIKGLELEVEDLKQKIIAADNRELLGNFTEERLTKKEAKFQQNLHEQQELEKEIADLKAVREKMNSSRAKRIPGKKIARLEKKLNRLKDKGAIIGYKQRKIMYPKYKHNLKRESLLFHAQGRVDNYEEKIQDNEELKRTLNKDHKLDSIKAVYYDVKGLYYQKRWDRSKEILNEMQTKKNIVTMYGSRVTSLSKKYLDKIRDLNNPVLNPQAVTR